MSDRKKKQRIIDEVNQFSTLFGEKTRFTGKIMGRDNCIVYGQVEGDCRCEGVLVLGEQGQWCGDIVAPKAIISGTVTGNIDASEKLELSATARIQGNITSPAMGMAEGAIHVGELHMGQSVDVLHFNERRTGTKTIPELSPKSAGLFDKIDKNQ